MDPSLFPTTVLQERLTAGLALRGGSRGSLTRCLGRLSAAAAATATTTTDTDKDKDTRRRNRAALRREILACHVEMIKLALHVQRQDAELRALVSAPSSSSLSTTTNNNNNNDNDNDNDTSAIQQTLRSRVVALRTAHQQAVATQACTREYEALAKVAHTRYPTPRTVLTAQLAHVEQATESAHQQWNACTAQVRLREKQFAALWQGLADLKQSLDEPFMLNEAEQTIRTTNNDQKEKNNNNNNDDDDEEEDDMQIDETKRAVDKNNDKEDDEEGALYEDL